MSTSLLYHAFGADFGEVEGPVRSKRKGRFGARGRESERSDAGVDLGGGGRVSGQGARLVTSHRGTFKGDPVGVVNETVEDGVAEGGIADDVMPVLDGELTGDEGRASSVAVFEDIEKVTALGVVERGHPEVVEHEELCA